MTTGLIDRGLGGQIALPAGPPARRARAAAADPPLPLIRPCLHPQLTLAAPQGGPDILHH